MKKIAGSPKNIYDLKWLKTTFIIFLCGYKSHIRIIHYTGIISYSNKSVKLFKGNRIHYIYLIPTQIVHTIRIQDVTKFQCTTYL